MNTCITIVFSSNAHAHVALPMLWDLDAGAELTVHRAAILCRDDMGHVRVADRSSDLAMRTAIGVGVGAHLGLSAGPVGVADSVAGAAALSVGVAIGVGAMAGGAVGLTANAVTENNRENAVDEGFFTLKHGQTAVAARISEDWTLILDP